MPYELRIFYTSEKLSSKSTSYSQELAGSFPDYYLYKKGLNNIGVKFRNIEQKKYGFTTSSVQFKVCTSESNSHHMNYYQMWNKYKIPFKYKFLLPFVYENKQYLRNKYKKQMQKQSKKNIELGVNENDNISMIQKSKWKSYNSQLNDLNHQLVTEVRSFFQMDSKFQNMLNDQNSELSRWLDPTYKIAQVFLIRKNKTKSLNFQTGLLSVQPLKTKFPLSFQKGIPIFSTISYQSSKKQKIQPKIKKNLQQKQEALTFEKLYQTQFKPIREIVFDWNCSYPQLLADLYEHFLQGHQLKSDKSINQKEIKQSDKEIKQSKTSDKEIKQYKQSDKQIKQTDKQRYSLTKKQESSIKIEQLSKELENFDLQKKIQ